MSLQISDFLLQVRLQDFFLADQITSQVLKLTCCFFVTKTLIYLFHMVIHQSIYNAILFRLHYVLILIHRYWTDHHCDLRVELLTVAKSVCARIFCVR